MTRHLGRSAGIVVALLAASCAEPEDDGIDQRVAQLEASQSALRQAVQNLSVRESQAATVSLDDDGAFSPIRTSSGFFTISLAGVEDAGGGSKIVLRIGNTLNADVERFTLVGYWTAQSGERKPIVLTKQERLRAGRWNRVTVPVGGVSSDTFSSFTLTDLMIERVSLLR